MSTFFLKTESPKGVDEKKSSWKRGKNEMVFKVFEAKFSKRKFIESKNKDFKDSENSIKKNEKTSGFTTKRRNIMSEIGINRLNSKSC